MKIFLTKWKTCSLMDLQENVMWFIHILLIIDIEKQHGNIHFKLNYDAGRLFFKAIILVCDFCSFTSVIRKMCQFVMCK